MPFHMFDGLYLPHFQGEARSAVRMYKQSKQKVDFVEKRSSEEEVNLMEVPEWNFEARHTDL